MNHSKYISYLSVPFDHKSAKVRKDRFEKVTKIAAKLLRMGYMPYSPITHNFPLKVNWPHDKWLKYDFLFLDKCKKLFVLKLKGWKKSKGVTAEIKRARKLGIPIVYLSYHK